MNTFKAFLGLVTLAAFCIVGVGCSKSNPDDTYVAPKDTGAAKPASSAVPKAQTAL